IPVDGSAFSRQIFDHVMQFLPPQDNALILLRVGDPPAGHVGHPARVATLDGTLLRYDSARDVEVAAHPIYASQERDSLEALFLAEMQTDLQRLRQAGYSVQSFVRFGEPGEEIVNFVEENEIDLVAMTTHWRRGINRLI